MKQNLRHTLYAWIVLVTVLADQVNANDIEYYEQLIGELYLSVQAYEDPENASIYQVENDTIIDYGEYDFVVIGAGPTGSVIANRLSEVGEWKVLLIEAGTFADNLTCVTGIYNLLRLTDWNWGYKTVPQTTACLASSNEECPVPKGKGVGGTTLINGLIYSRGNPIDYDIWAQLTEDDSWAYQNVLRYFEKSEDLHQTDPLAPINWYYHSRGGYWNTENNLPRNELTDIFLNANAELGFDITDYNTPQQIGVSITQYSTKKGRREDHGTAFILPILGRNNLEVLTESYVTKIEIDNVTKTATGVIFTKSNQTFRAAARKEVILSAGAISSPHLLMLSGIGPYEHLNNLSIPVIADLPVGVALRDHPTPYGLLFSTNISTANYTFEEEIAQYLEGIGYLATTTSPHVLSFYKSDVETIPNYPDLELTVTFSGTASTLTQKILQLNDETFNALYGNSTANTINIVLILIHSHSIGSVRLKSSNPFDYPLIDSNLLSDPEGKDIEALYEGINIVLELMNTTVFRGVGAALQGEPLPACSDYSYLSKDYWYCFLRQLTVTSFHPVSTCSMGTDPKTGAVVDPKLKVFGINGLRVADASVFPITPTGHPTAGCTMVGEKISDVIKIEYGV